MTDQTADNPITEPAPCSTCGGSKVVAGGERGETYEDCPMCPPEAPKHPGGRPTLYTDELAAFICTEIASGEKITDICLAESMPSPRSVYTWLAKYPEFSQQYAKAQADRANAMAEEILDIADDGRNDWMERHYGETTAWVTNGEALQRSRLRVDTRKWLMSKMVPKKYGDKLDLGNADDKPFKVNHTIERHIIDPKNPDSAGIPATPPAEPV